MRQLPLSGVLHFSFCFIDFYLQAIVYKPRNALRGASQFSALCCFQDKENSAENIRRYFQGIFCSIGKSSGLKTNWRSLPLCLTPQGGQHRNDLLFTAHNLGQEYTIVFRGNMECLADDLIIANIQQLAAFQENVCQH